MMKERFVELVLARTDNTPLEKDKQQSDSKRVEEHDGRRADAAKQVCDAKQAERAGWTDRNTLASEVVSEIVDEEGGNEVKAADEGNLNWDVRQPKQRTIVVMITTKGQAVGSVWSSDSWMSERFAPDDGVQSNVAALLAELMDLDFEVVSQSGVMPELVFTLKKHVQAHRQDGTYSEFRDDDFLGGSGMARSDALQSNAFMNGPVAHC